MYAVSEAQFAILVLGALLIITIAISITSRMLRHSRHSYTAVTCTAAVVCSAFIAIPLSILVMAVNTYRLYAGILVLICSGILLFELYDVYRSCKRKGCFALLCGYLAALVYVTILNRFGRYLPWIKMSLQDASQLEFEDFRHFGLNACLYIPIGILTALSSNKYKKIRYTIIGTMLSLCTETTQLVFSIGECDIGDVMSNTLGMFIGICIGKYLDNLASEYGDL